ncbi:uncharacterized protein HMPREF1541_06079 [Cyphellophora europaea CBS 101466]|uniref:Dihydrofolate reductase n=1 Tax=Cyphellophora europaea (strain CBS 101466) TaxID=1220924 RepID=W2RVR1_CYPE1|nr:uncharacterized protein HMPREF1541_06079 [Cyphellophora europaea CBS 101466]ETN39853.1 hypothetical protein HMPREF1541_06079 [Cyphellophora europaea CBS 101466]
MAPPPRPLYLIVATTISPPLGIGARGTLPWPSLRADMNFFQRVTRDTRPTHPVPTPVSKPQHRHPSSSFSEPNAPATPTTTTINAVIMGRKTYASIPPAYRPLSNRLNVILTRREPHDVATSISEELQAATDGAPVAVQACSSDSSGSSRNGSGSGSGSVLLRSLADSKPPPPVIVASDLARVLRELWSASGSAYADGSGAGAGALLRQAGWEVGNVFVIGGAELYREALQVRRTWEAEPRLRLRVLQTEVRRVDGAEVEGLDTFFPGELGGEGGGGVVKVEGEELGAWLNVGEGGKEIKLPQGDGKWASARDEKGEFEVRVSGWEM